MLLNRLNEVVILCMRHNTIVIEGEVIRRKIGNGWTLFNFMDWYTMQQLPLKQNI